MELALEERGAALGIRRRMADFRSHASLIPAVSKNSAATA
jgi:hypothetical protein